MTGDKCQSLAKIPIIVLLSPYYISLRGSYQLVYQDIYIIFHF